MESVDSPQIFNLLLIRVRSPYTSDVWRGNCRHVVLPPFANPVTQRQAQLYNIILLYVYCRVSGI